MSKRKKEEIVAFTSEESKRIGSAIVTAMNENASEAGSKLLNLAKQQENKIFMESVVSRVQELVSHRNMLQLADEKLHREIALFDKRIAAIEAGAFKLGYNGKIEYNDILLNY